LLRLLSGGNFAHVMVVGDEQQSIYRWRDARVENIREFTGRTVVLSENYRSVPDILALASRFIGRDADLAGSGRALEPRRPSAGTAVTVFHPADEAGESPREEAGAVAAWIRGLVQEGKVGSCGDVAVLMRSLKTPTLTHLEEEFSRLGIPYAVLGPGNSLETLVLACLSRILSLLVDPGRIDALVYLLEREPLALGDRALYELFQAARRVGERGRSGGGREEPVLCAADVLAAEAIEQMSEPEARRRCRALTDTIDLLRRDLSSLDLPLFVWSVVERATLLVRLFAAGGSEVAWENITRSLVALFDEMERVNEHGLAAFVEYLEAAATGEETSFGAEPRLPEDRVKIMTIHQAKGLEFPAVALAGMKQRRGRSPSFFVSPESGLLIKGYPGREPDVLAEAEKEKSEQEERCLVYVAITRAKDHVMISSPCPRGVKNQSPLFTEILECLQESGIAFRELREKPAAVDSPSGPKRAPRGSVEAELERWRRARERIDAYRPSAGTAARDLQPVTWRGLVVFMQC
ncbi:MAG: 3'-5' exonuclease, partial [Candidatus Bipolaricaulia bacterium]